MKIITRQDKARDILKALQEQLKTTDPALLHAYIANNRCEQYLAAFVTNDQEMLAVKRLVRVLVNIDDPVLITGPSGTGKELIARALHGMRDPADFYAINMAGLPEGLIESELFGHRKGAFTGATVDHPGIFLSAGSGTVFLDEIGEAPLNLQAKLLRALQPDINGKRHIRPVGAAEPEEISCRIIAATKVDLFAAVANGKFREDLYGRLMAFEIVLTPLSARPADKLPIALSMGLDVSALPELDTPYWQQRMELFNVRAIQAFARRKAVGL